MHQFVIHARIIVVIRGVIRVRLHIHLVQQIVVQQIIGYFILVVLSI